MPRTANQAAATEAKAVWIVSDGNPGHYNQSLAVAEALVRDGYGPIGWVKSRRVRGFFRPSLGLLVDMTRGPLPKSLEDALIESELPAEAPKIIISSGKTAYASVALSRRFGALNVFIDKPPGMSGRHFHAIMHTDEHWSPANGMRLDLLPTRLSPQEVQEKNTTFRAEMGFGTQRLCSMLIGGDSRSHSFLPEDWRALTAGMNRLAAAQGFKWLVTSSRRTGAEGEEIVRTGLDSALIADSTWWGVHPRPVVVSYLSASDVVFCTQDSMTMLSEGIVAGKPTYALYPDTVRHRGLEGSFNKRFLEQQTAAHRLRRVHVAQLGSVDMAADTASYFKTITTDVMHDMIVQLLALLKK